MQVNNLFRVNSGMELLFFDKVAFTKVNSGLYRTNKTRMAIEQMPETGKDLVLPTASFPATHPYLYNFNHRWSLCGNLSRFSKAAVSTSCLRE